jgi:predicted transcriptional regulator
MEDTLFKRRGRDRVAALDKLTEARTRDRALLRDEAFDGYAELRDWQIEHVQEGLRHADAGMGKDHH